MTAFDVFGEEFDFWARMVRGNRHYEEWQSILPGSSDRVLDVGCGSGHLSMYLADRVNNVVGIDISLKMIGMAKKNKAEQRKNNVHFVIANLESAPLLEQSFDLVLSDTAFGHLQLDLVLPMLRRIVKKDGRLILRELVNAHPKLASSPFWLVLQRLKALPGNIRRFGPHTATRILFFQLKPSWIRHECGARWLTPQSFQTIYSRFLPGCQFKDFGWTMAAIWEPGFATDIVDSRS
jgi:ubiquinone/menaquinone biosynthesis C-methylase UbiE